MSANTPITLQYILPLKLQEKTQQIHVPIL
nr:MAG TPA: hypothetical protein [Caudoviricetes sp.]